MNPISEDIKDLLEADSSLELELGVNLFVGMEPPTPDDCVTLYDTGGRGPQLTFNRNEHYYHGRFQVRIRSKSYLIGMNLAQTLMDYLHGRGHEEINSTDYNLIQAGSAPAFIGRDANHRLLFVVNFEVQRREA